MPTLLVVLLLGGAAYLAAQHLGWTEQFMGWLDPSRAHRPVAGDTVPAGPLAGSPSLPPSAPPHPPAPSRPVAAVPPPERAAELPRPAAAAPEAQPPPSPLSAPPPPQPLPPIGQAPKPGVDPEPGTHVTPPAPAVQARGPRVVAKKPRAGGGGGGSRDVFKESARRVRSLSQGLDQLPPGTIELPPPMPDPPPNP